MNHKLKTTLLASSFLLIGAWCASVFAQISVKSDISNAIQNIGKVYFSKDGIKWPDSNTNILVTAKDGVLLVEGEVILSSTANKNSFKGKENIGSAIIAGEKNMMDKASDSLIAAGKINTIKEAKWAIIIAGERNKIESWSDDAIILGGRQNEIKGKGSMITAWTRNIIQGSWSIIAWGSLNTVKWDNNFAAGMNIKFDKDRSGTFVWSDSESRIENTFVKPQQDNVFLIRSLNGVAIGKAAPAMKGVDVAGAMKVGYNEEVCSDKTAGAIMYVGGQGGCFCSCDGSTGKWSMLSIKDSCRDTCLRNGISGTVTVEEPEPPTERVCKYCATSGFPYCLSNDTPVDFNPNCDENTKPVPAPDTKKLTEQEWDNFVNGLLWNREGNSKNIFINEKNAGIGAQGGAGYLNVEGPIKLGSQTITCNASMGGVMKYETKTMQFCNGSEWITLGN